MCTAPESNYFKILFEIKCLIAQRFAKKSGPSRLRIPAQWPVPSTCRPARRRPGCWDPTALLRARQQDPRRPRLAIRRGACAGRTFRRSRRVFFNRERRHLYVAIGEPGLIEVFDTDKVRRLEAIQTEAGAHTLGFDPGRNTIYAFLPKTHRALVFVDRG
jgi:hypothetical protein